MTDVRFDILLEELIGLQPSHPLIPKYQREGNTLINGLTIGQIVKNAQSAHHDGIGQSTGQPKDDDPEDEILKNERIRQRNLYRERADLSNSLHDAGTVQDRAGISEEIQIVQRNIERCNKRIRHYKIHGSMPDDEQLKHYVPKDGAELERRKRSLLSAISRKKKHISELRAATMDEVAGRKLEKALDKLKELQADLKNVKEAIANL